MKSTQKSALNFQFRLQRRSRMLENLASNVAKRSYLDRMPGFGTGANDFTLF